MLELTCAGRLRCDIRGISMARLDQAMISSTCFLLLPLLTQPSQSYKFPWQHLAHTVTSKGPRRIRWFHATNPAETRDTPLTQLEGYGDLPLVSVRERLPL